MYKVEIANLSEYPDILPKLIAKLEKLDRVIFLANRETDMFVFGADETSLQEAEFVAEQLNKFYENKK